MRSGDVEGKIEYEVGRQLQGEEVYVGGQKGNDLNARNAKTILKVWS